MTRFFLLAFALFPLSCNAITLSEFRLGFNDDQRRGYLIGIYDARLIEPSRTECLERIGGVRFSWLVSDFVRSLPADESSKERRVYDAMNMALIASIVIDKECKTLKR